MIGKVLKCMEQQRVDCILVIPAINSPWVNLVSAYITDLMEISKPFDDKAFFVLNGKGKRLPKKYPHTMIAVKLSFSSMSPFLRLRPSTVSFKRTVSCIISSYLFTACRHCLISRPSCQPPFPPRSCKPSTLPHSRFPPYPERQ